MLQAVTFTLFKTRKCLWGIHYYFITYFKKFFLIAIATVMKECLNTMKIVTDFTTVALRKAHYSYVYKLGLVSSVY